MHAYVSFFFWDTYQEDVAAVFSKADKNNSGTIKVSDFKTIMLDICERYPQVEIYLKKQQLKSFDQLLKNRNGNDEVIDIEKFKLALSEVDIQMKNLPATAQVNFRKYSTSTLLCWILNSHQQSQTPKIARKIGY